MGFVTNSQLKAVEKTLVDNLKSGKLPVKALTTKQIDPVSEESGIIHDIPFISQGTGTANNTASVDTSPVAKHLEKRGYTVVNNQLANKASFPASATQNDVTFTNNNDGLITANGTNTTLGSNAYYYALTNYSINSAHKYLVRGCPVGGTVSGGGSTYWVNISSGKNDTGKGVIITNLSTIDYRISVAPGVTVNNLKFTPQVIDLTQYFSGNDKIPQDLLDHPEHWPWYNNGTGAYDAGTLKNANGRYLVCTERQLFNPATVVSGQLEVDGTASSSSSYKTSDYILIVPNRTYYIEKTSSSRIKFYDINKQPLRTDAYDVSIPGSAASTFTAPPNAIYARFTVSNSLVNNTGLSLYYSPEQGGEGYNQHYDYVEPKVYDTGTENLLAYDTKDHYGTWHKNTIHVDLGSLAWTMSSSYSNVFYANIPGAYKTTNQWVGVVYGICAEYLIEAKDPTALADKTGTMNTTFIGTSANIVVKDTRYSDAASFKAAVSGVYIDVMAATPTTEQGTAFSEDIEIDDYGMIYWLDTDGNLVSTPQGCKLFYPADYVRYTDTLHSYTNGDPEAIALKGELASGDPETLKGAVDLSKSYFDIMKENVGGALRHQLVANVVAGGGTLDFLNTDWVDLGNFTYTHYSPTSNSWSTDQLATLVKIPPSDNDAAHILCSYFKTSTRVAHTSMCIDVASNGLIWISLPNSANMTAEQVKSALSGIILAYEKASS